MNVRSGPRLDDLAVFVTWACVSVAWERFIRPNGTDLMTIWKSAEPTGVTSQFGPKTSCIALCKYDHFAFRPSGPMVNVNISIPPVYKPGHASTRNLSYAAESCDDSVKSANTGRALRLPFVAMLNSFIQ